jgi:mono/diheme cytochrome c family protein
MSVTAMLKLYPAVSFPTSGFRPGMAGQRDIPCLACPKSFGTNAGNLSDDDIRAVIAYIRSLPAAGKPTEKPPDHLNPLRVMMLGAGMLPKGKPVSIGIVTVQPKSPTLQYGEYILSYQDCRACHGDKLTGGVPGQLRPLGPDLNLVKGWKLEEFIAIMRTGVDPNGHELSKQMPWRPIRRMGDEDLHAVYEYLTHLPG